MSGSSADSRRIEPWQVAELPEPPSTRGLGWLRVVGPGAIILGVSLGSGEWLLGPAAFVKYGLSLLWVTLVALFFQTIFNTELIRYTMYTGEPVLVGFLRLRPGPGFWGGLYLLFFFVQVAWPVWAISSAGAVFYLFSGRLPTAVDAEKLYVIGSLTFVLCVLILIIGERIVHTLEILNWILIAFILGGLLVLCLFYAAPEKWGQALWGLIGYNPVEGRFDLFPPGADWFLIGAFAGYSGAGGVVNLMVSSWARDKGLGMAGQSGFIPAAIGARRVPLAHTGSIFKVDEQSLPRWRRWWRFNQVDQWLIFFGGALVGMVLPALLYTSFLEPGSDIRGSAIAAALSSAMAQRGAAVFAYLVALMGVWLLFKTQLNIVEGMARSVTDMIWAGDPNIRRLSRGDVRFVYYVILGAIVLWGLLALRLSEPIVLLQVGANIAGLVFVVSAMQVLHVNTTLLPDELQPPMWRRMALVCMAVFYGGFVYVWLMGGIIPDPAKGFLFNIPRYFLGGP